MFRKRCSEIMALLSFESCRFLKFCIASGFKKVELVPAETNSLKEVD